jgi:hypothetical protein
MLLAGTEDHMDRMIGFPLLSAYGALDAVVAPQDFDRCLNPIDLFADAWSTSLSTKISAFARPPGIPADQPNRNEDDELAAEALPSPYEAGQGAEQ